MTKIKVYQKLVTPEMAKKYLDKNKGNRKLTERNTQFFYQQMATGKWMLAADPIKFGEDGRLLDGQHRLKALIKYGKPLEMFIAEGLSDNVFSVLDTGRNRNASDILSIKGYKSFNALSATAKSILMFNAGVYSDHNKTSKDFRASNQMILEFVEKNPRLHEDINYVNAIYRRFRYLGFSRLVMLYFLLSKKNAEKADEFFEKYSTGIDLNQDSPIRILRERFILDSQNKTKLTLRDKTAIFIHAWNAYISNKKIERIKLTKDYDFPKPV